MEFEEIEDCGKHARENKHYQFKLKGTSLRLMLL